MVVAKRLSMIEVGAIVGNIELLPSRVYGFKSCLGHQLSRHEDRPLSNFRGLCFWENSG